MLDQGEYAFQHVGPKLGFMGIVLGDPPQGMPTDHHRSVLVGQIHDPAEHCVTESMNGLTDLDPQGIVQMPEQASKVGRVLDGPASAHEAKSHQDFVEFVINRQRHNQEMEDIAREKRFPIIGPVVGQFCYQTARMIGARQIFELGSGFGYSTAWFAKAVAENVAFSGDGTGVVHHVVWDDVLSRQAQQSLKKLGYNQYVEYHIGEAVETLANTPGTFDLIFNDIDKEGYPASLPVILEKLRPGGVLIVDNMLWHGRIFNENDQDESTQGVREITQLLFESTEWIATLLPIRDGLIVAYKQ